MTHNKCFKDSNTETMRFPYHYGMIVVALDDKSIRETIVWATTQKDRYLEAVQKDDYEL